MAATADQRHVRQEFEGLAFPKFQVSLRAYDPLSVGGMNMHLHVKRAGPLRHACIEVRVRYRHRLDAAERLDQRHGRGIEHRDAIPKHVAMRGAQQERALPDRKARLRANADDAGLIFVPRVEVSQRQLLLRGPALPGVPDVLPLILANRARRRSSLRRRILSPAGRANESGHRAPLNSA